jgi:hypothetical protein
VGPASTGQVIIMRKQFTVIGKTRCLKTITDSSKLVGNLIEKEALPKRLVCGFIQGDS